MGLIAQNNTSKKDTLKELYPSYVDTTNARYMVIDNMYVSSFLISNYEHHMEGGFLDKLLALGVDMQISMYYEKLNTREILRKITYQIGNTGADIKNSNENQIDINIMNKKYNDAKYIREKMQIDGEELYHLYLYILIYSNSPQNLDIQTKKVETMLSAIGLTRR